VPILVSFSEQHAAKGKTDPVARLLCLTGVLNTADVLSCVPSLTQADSLILLCVLIIVYIAASHTVQGAAAARWPVPQGQPLLRRLHSGHGCGPQPARQGTGEHRSVLQPTLTLI
jgi:hypothetical protein